MRFTPTLIAAALIGFGGLALAGQDYMIEAKQVSEMMAKTKMTPASTDEARKLFADSERMMKEGKDKEAMALLEQVKKLLSMQK